MHPSMNNVMFGLNLVKLVIGIGSVVLVAGIAWGVGKSTSSSNTKDILANAKRMEAIKTELKSNQSELKGDLGLLREKVYQHDNAINGIEIKFDHIKNTLDDMRSDLRKWSEVRQ